MVAVLLLLLALVFLSYNIVSKKIYISTIWHKIFIWVSLLEITQMVADIPRFTCRSRSPDRRPIEAVRELIISDCKPLRAKKTLCFAINITVSDKTIVSCSC